MYRACPWADGYFNRNLDSPLPRPLAVGEAITLPLRVADPIQTAGSTREEVRLDVILFGTSEQDTFAVCLNGTRLAIAARDAGWRDPQIF